MRIDPDAGRIAHFSWSCSRPAATGRARPVRAGEDFTCALAESGRVYCWGDEGPAISAGREHACAIDRDGAAWCWGSNRYGELGDGTRTPSFEPLRVGFGS